MAEPNRLRDMDGAGSPGAVPRDRPISPHLPLFAGLGLVVSGVAMFAVGGSRAQTLGIGLTSLGAGVATASALLRNVRELGALRASKIWQFVPQWSKPLLFVRVAGIGLGVAMLVGFALFMFFAAAFGAQG